MKKLYIDYDPSCVRTALVENGKLLEFSVEHSTAGGLVGNIYKGKVENVLSGMKAAFVGIGLERNGYLCFGDTLVDSGGIAGGRNLPRQINASPGDVIMVQVVKDEFGLKGARLSTDITVPGNYLVLLPTSSFIGISRKISDAGRREYLENLLKSQAAEGMGFIVRSAAVKAEDGELIEEAESLLSLWRKIEADYKKALPKSLVFKEAELLERAIRDNLHEEVDAVVVNDEAIVSYVRGLRPMDADGEKKRSSKPAPVEVYNGERNVFRHFGIAEQIDKICERRTDLESGAHIVIDKTEALTVIDVNTGRYVGTHDLEDTVFRANLEAAKEIAGQLRVRNISGIIIIDFIDMKTDSHRKEVLRVLEKELKADKVKCQVVSMTSLGLVELTRKRTRLPADTHLLQPCANCSGGFVVSDEHNVIRLRDELIEYTLSYDFAAYLVRVNPTTLSAIKAARFFDRVKAGLWKTKRIYLIPDGRIGRESFEITVSNEKILTLPGEAVLL
jgi:ribonuclease G